jgi:uncharacterized protein YbjT (DUF2867 family)
MITIFGATGHTGGAAASRLLKAGQQVRVVGRQREKLSPLVKAGAEACVGDIEDAKFVGEALKGADAAFVLIPPNMVTDDFRAYQLRVVESVSTGIETSGLGHVALLSSIGAHHSEGTGPILGVRAFEKRLAKITQLNALFLRPGFFMENVFMGMASIKAQGIYSGAMPAEATIQPIASVDIGNYAAVRLERRDFSGKKAVHLQGPRAISQGEIAAILGQAIGKPVRYVQISLDEVERGMHQAGLKPSITAAFMEMNRGAAKGLVAPETGGEIVTTQTSFETFADEVFAPAYRA